MPLAGGRAVGDVASRILAQAPTQFALLGFSLGGIVASHIAALAPSRVMGLALVDANVAAIEASERPARRDAARQAAGDVVGYVSKVLWPQYVARTALGDEAIRRLVLDMASGGAADFLAQIDMAIDRPDGFRCLRHMDMPALVVAGEDDALCPPGLQREMAAALPDAALALIKDAGHFALLEKPEAVAAQVAKWLSRIDALVL